MFFYLFDNLIVKFCHKFHPSNTQHYEKFLSKNCLAYRAKLYT
jgi:hypothetical protein